MLGLCLMNHALGKMRVEESPITLYVRFATSPEIVIPCYTYFSHVMASFALDKERNAEWPKPS
jgi:hypothetical protein